MRWVRRHAAELGIDANRIVASGGSAGGFLASSVAVTSDLDVPGDDRSISPTPNALVLFNPVVDLVAVGRSDLTNESESLKRISPAFHLTRKYPPTVILIGSEDRFLEQIEKFVKEAQTLGVRMEMEVYAGQPHAFFNKDPWTGKTAARADQFLQSLGYLSAEPAIEPPQARKPIQNAQ
jgi:acetyl esterase/lipase